MSNTPGPWWVNGKQSIRGPKGEYIARANWRNGEANARLIAAAPELLEACKRLSFIMPWMVEGAGEALSMASAAIAKAEGKK